MAKENRSFAVACARATDDNMVRKDSFKTRDIGKCFLKSEGIELIMFNQKLYRAER